MKDKPLVSIITTSYNQSKFVEDTLLSVKNQDYPNIEHIIVDGGSTDNTLEILRKYENEYNLRWISESDEGQSCAVNKGFKTSEGEPTGFNGEIRWVANKPDGPPRKCLYVSKAKEEFWFGAKMGFGERIKRTVGIKKNV